jgi:hypothetical protein
VSRRRFLPDRALPAVRHRRRSREQLLLQGSPRIFARSLRKAALDERVGGGLR